MTGVGDRGAAGPVIGQADRHVDRHDFNWSVGLGGDKFIDVGSGVGGGRSTAKYDADPSGLAGINS